MPDRNPHRTASRHSHRNPRRTAFRAGSRTAFRTECFTPAGCNCTIPHRIPQVAIARTSVVCSAGVSGAKGQIPSTPSPSHPTPFRPVPSHPVPCHPTPPRPISSIPSHPIPSYPILPHPIPSHPIPSHPIPSHPIPGRAVGSATPRAVWDTSYVLQPSAIGGIVWTVSTWVRQVSPYYRLRTHLVLRWRPVRVHCLHCLLSQGCCSWAAWAACGKWAEV